MAGDFCLEQVKTSYDILGAYDCLEALLKCGGPDAGGSVFVLSCAHEQKSKKPNANAKLSALLQSLDSEFLLRAFASASTR